MRRQWLVRHGFCKIMSIDCSTSACCLLTWIQSPVGRQAVEIPMCKSCLTKWSHLGLSTKCRSSNWDAPETLPHGQLVSTLSETIQAENFRFQFCDRSAACYAFDRCCKFLAQRLGWFTLDGFDSRFGEPIPATELHSVSEEFRSKNGLACLCMPLACTNICPCRNWAALNVTGDQCHEERKGRPCRQGKAEAIEFT